MATLVAIKDPGDFQLTIDTYSKSGDRSWGYGVVFVMTSSGPEICATS